MKIYRNKSNDRRAVYTRKLIHDTYIELLKNTPTEKISIAHLCKKASINRSTFYLHYRDIIQLSEEIEDKLFENIKIYINQILENYNDRETISAHWVRSTIDDPLFQIIRIRFGIVIQRIVDYSKKILVELCIKSNQLTQREAEIWATYWINGTLAVCNDLFDRGSENENYEEESAFLNKMIRYSNSFLNMEKINEQVKNFKNDL